MQTLAPAAKRAACPHCARPLATCFCARVCLVASAVEVLILQHPHEVSQTKGTARLLHACLPQSRLQVGESFDAAQLNHWLQAAEQGELPRRAVLLYPPTPECAALGMAAPPELPAEWLAAPQRLRLVVLDGSWRKSRKMLYLNPALQALPRLALNPEALPAARYAIRKAQHPAQRSTLEAVCAALALLDNNAARYAPILAAMDGFVAQQLGYKGAP